MTPSGIEPATFRFVAQHLNHCATAVPNEKAVYFRIVLLVCLSVLLLLIGTLAKQFLKPSISLAHACHSVCPLDSHWMNICEISYLRLLLKYVGICRFWL